MFGKTNIVSCEECKFLLDKDDAFPVYKKYCYIFGADNERVVHYCKNHKKEYDRVIHSYGGTSFVKDCVAVDSEGTPLGYKKIKNGKK